MSGELRRSIILSLVSILISLVLGELMVRVIDPAGRYTLAASQRRYHVYMEPDPRGYTLMPGQHDLLSYQATIDDEGNRALPDRPDARCTIAFIGDSVTFGVGVNDDQVFPYLIAQDLPDVRFVNTGKSGFNARNLLRTVESLDVDGYVYLAVPNDNEYPADEPENAIRLPEIILASRLYLYAGSYSGPPPEDPDWKRYMTEWLDRYPVLKVVYEQEGVVMPWLLETYPDAVWIPAYAPHLISLVDGHPNPEGHEQLANDMLPHVRAFVAEVCP